MTAQSMTDKYETGMKIAYQVIATAPDGSTRQESRPDRDAACNLAIQWAGELNQPVQVIAVLESLLCYAWGDGFLESPTHGRDILTGLFADGTSLDDLAAASVKNGDAS